MDRHGIVEGDQTRKTAQQNEENNGSSTADVSPIKSEPIPRASGDETTESDVESKSGVASSTSGVLMQNIEGVTAVRENREFPSEQDSKVRMKKFIKIDESGKDIEQNRRILESIIGCVEFCGRQGIGLRGHRDGGQYRNMGNFIALINLVSRKDKDLEKYPKNATYLSKNTQNDLLRCMLKNIQDKIVDEVTQQKHGSYFGIIANVVTDSKNSKGVWIVLRYLKDKCTPVERLLGYVKCENITDEEIFKYISNAGIDKSKCRGQICYNAGYSAGKQNGAENQLKEEPGNEEATYFHCASHQLDLFSKASTVPEAYHVICLMEKLGLFFEYSSNRQRALEKSVEDVCKKAGKDPNEAREKVKLLCKTKWVEQQAAFDDLEQLYGPLLDCLDFIERNEENRWDPKDIDEAAGINTQIRDSKFIVPFVVCHYIFGVSKDLAPKLKGFPKDTIVLEVRDVIENLRKICCEDVDEFSELFSKCEDMAKLADTTLAKPRVIRRQFLRNNDQEENLKGYFRRSVCIPFVDHVTSELKRLFPGHVQAALYLVPKYLAEIDEGKKNKIFECYGDALPSPVNFREEVSSWESHWSAKPKEDLHSTFEDTLSKIEDEITEKFSNITTILKIALTYPVNYASAKRTNSALRFIKTPPCRSRMTEERLTALLLLFVDTDIRLDYDKIIDMFMGGKSKRRNNPLTE